MTSILIKRPALSVKKQFLAVILAAWKSGLSDKEIEFGMRNIEAVEHRLKRIDSGSGVLVLDDAFNSNYNGAIEAVNVLNEIGEHKKIIVTPGFVELGEMEEEQNRKFGNYMASKIDYAILVGGGKSMSIRDGLLDNGFSYNHIFAQCKTASFPRPSYLGSLIYLEVIKRGSN